MDYFVPIILLIIVPALVAYFIARGVFNRLKRKENKNARLISVTTFIGCFLVLFAGIVYTLLSFVRLER